MTLLPLSRDIAGVSGAEVEMDVVDALGKTLSEG